jgi:uroporphyrinogen III methyltransferase/synthase
MTRSRSPASCWPSSTRETPHGGDGHRLGSLLSHARARRSVTVDHPSPGWGIRFASPMRVIVTRPRSQAGPLVERLEDLGHEVVVCPLIEIEPISDEPVDAAGYDWVIVTSPNGADELARRGRNLPRIAAVGPGTAERLREHGLEPSFVPSVSSQDGLLAEFPRPPGRVLFAAAAGARRAPIEQLGADFVPLYRTRLLEPKAPVGDVVVLASGSAARAYAGIGGSTPAVTIGPETSGVARQFGVNVIAEASTHDLDGLLAAILTVTR